MLSGYWAVELSAVNPADSSTVTRRFAQGMGRAPTDVSHVPTGLVRWKSPGQKIDVGSTGVVRSTADKGELVIANNAPGPILPGYWDSDVTYAWQDRVASLYWVPGTAWSGKILVARGLLEQPVADLVSLKFPLKDPRAALDTPLQNTLFAGDNVLPAGVEGGEDIKGTPKPLGYGVFANVTPRLVNSSRLIYLLTANVSIPLCVRDGGIPLTAGTLRASAASLQSNIPAPGTYDYTSNSTDGCLIRVGSTPIYGIKCDGQEGATAADRTHAQIWKRIRTELCDTSSGDIDGASVTAVDGLDSYEVGWYFDQAESRRDALDKVLGSLVGYEVQDLTGSWSIGRLAVPSGSPEFNLVQALAVDVQAIGDRALLSLDRTRPGWEQQGSPPFRVNLRCLRNYSVMSRTDFAGAASEYLKEALSREWRVESATDSAIWDPDTATGDFPNAPDLTIDTGYIPDDGDDRTFPQVAARADELLTLFSGLKGHYIVRFLPDGPWISPDITTPDNILPGTVISATYSRFGMETGPLFVILQSGWLVEEGREPKADLLIGLQT
jgi:hypothetical protein